MTEPAPETPAVIETPLKPAVEPNEKTLRLLALFFPRFEEDAVAMPKLMSDELAKAEQLTPEKAAILDSFHKAFQAAFPTHKARVLEIIESALAGNEIEALLLFGRNPMEPLANIGVDIHNANVDYINSVKDHDPATWDMLMGYADDFVEKNTPENVENIRHEQIGSDAGWERVDAEVKTAEEYTPPPEAA